MPMNTEGKSSESSEGVWLKANAELGIGGDSGCKSLCRVASEYGLLISATRLNKLLHGLGSPLAKIIIKSWLWLVS